MIKTLKVKILVKLLTHNVYARDGLDIIYTSNISFKESITGFNFILKHLNGKSYKIKNVNNEIIHNNTKIIMNNLGFQRDSIIGKLIIKFNINYPKALNQNIIDKLKELL